MNELSGDAMRVTADGDVRPHEDRCDGECHEQCRATCPKCDSLSTDLMCLLCMSYLALDTDGDGVLG